MSGLNAYQLENLSPRETLMEQLKHVKYQHGLAVGKVQERLKGIKQARNEEFRLRQLRSQLSRDIARLNDD